MPWKSKYPAKKRSYRKSSKPYYYSRSSAGSTQARRNFYIANIDRPIRATESIFKIPLTNGNTSECFQILASGSGGAVKQSWNLGGSNLNATNSDFSFVSGLYDQYRIIAAEASFWPVEQAEATYVISPLVVYYDPDSVNSPAASTMAAMSYENKKIISPGFNAKQNFKTRIPKYNAFNTSLATGNITCMDDGFVDIAINPYFGCIGWYSDQNTASQNIMFSSCQIILVAKYRR